MSSYNEQNPYVTPPSAEIRPHASFPLFLLWIAPWKMTAAVRTGRTWINVVFGFAGATVQIGLFLAVLAGQIDEPFRDLAECIREVAIAIPFTLVLGGFFSSMFFLMIASRDPWARPLTLIPWAMLGLFAAWIVCFFCRSINHPHFGILNDDRPDWMTNTFVLAFGSPFTWLGVCTIAFVWVWLRAVQPQEDARP